uniref:Plexin A [Tribolium castaneum] n=1 Tax=Lepeophtheirus salmonis TaxID=72036 RepID=A0A0K2U8T1_LEPSM
MSSDFSRVSFLSVWILFTCCPGNLKTHDIVARFQDKRSGLEGSKGPALNNLVVDKVTGLVYVGAVNRLYQLHPDLTRRSTVVTGPQEDTPQCSVIPKCRFPTRLTDNVNKALVIDYAESRLIACGSLFQGACSIRSLRNISHVEREVFESVVANNATATTVVFIAPGPPNPPISRVLYVGVSFTANGPYRTDVPAIASRSLEGDRLLQIAEISLTTGTRMHINSIVKQTYPINYIYGFSSEGFSYFLTTQMKRTQASPFHSRLIRVCHDDQDYYSYTEIPIECISSNSSKNYNLVQAAYLGKPASDLASNLGITVQDDVLFAVFSESDSSEGEISSKPSKNSALCLYSLKSVRRKFTQNIQRCFSGKGSKGLDFISTSFKCINTRFLQIGEEFCGLNVNTPFGGDLPLTVEPVITFDNSLLTAVTAMSTGDYTVAFIGTGDGYLKKVAVSSSNSGLEYSTIQISKESKVNPDITFDLKREHIYVMTEKQVSKVRVEYCSRYTTCGECLAAKDPYCGWCSLKNKCLLSGDCKNDTMNLLYWISYKSGLCTTITQVKPKELQSTTSSMLTLSIDNLQSLSGQFICVFATLGKTLITDATLTSNKITCMTPTNDLLPLIPANEHNYTSALSVRMSKGPDLVSTNFTFFDCNTFNTCSSCVSSNFPCDWCVDAHRCTHDTAEYCQNDILVTGAKSFGPSIRSGPGFCPQINITSDGGSSEILVSTGISKAIRVKIYNIASFMGNTGFVCQFNIEGRSTSTNAQMLGDIIYCEDMEFSYTSRAPKMNALFAVIWGGSKPLDNPDNIHVLIYNCKEMADNCGLCLSLDEKFECGWCESSGMCEVQGKCGKDATSWLNRDKTCPNPMVLDFHPTTGPWEGGTNITIHGINLGKQFNDIYGGVTVAGVYCDPYAHLYQRTEKIVCKLEGPGTLEKKNGPVIVHVADFRGESTEDYEFIDPQLKYIRPLSGPQSGGTRIRIIGEYLNAGSHIEAIIGDSPCQIVETRPDMAICITSASKSLSKELVKMIFDKGIRELECQKYEYVEDPIIHSVYSGSLGGRVQKILKGIVSGGINITVVGQNFNYIQEPIFYVHYKGNHYYSNPCNVVNNKKMFCLSPRVESLAWININQPEPIDLNFGFVMDNVDRVQNISNVLNSYFLLYPDPEFYKFDEEDGIKYYKFDYLTLNGKNLNRALKESDIKVRIGKKFCNVTSLSLNQLTCRPPETKPEPLTDMSNDLPEVIVMIGDNLEYRIGHLSYPSVNFASFFN